MSVQLKVLQGGSFQDVEIMAPDYDAEYVWLWFESDGANRIDLSREQCRQLRDELNKFIPPSG